MHTPKCSKCGEVCFDAYMVHKEIWLSVMTSRKGFLHWKCLEQLLGRPLQKQDVTEAPINNIINDLFDRLNIAEANVGAYQDDFRRSD